MTRVSGLVVGEDPLLLVADDSALLEPGDDALEGIVEVDVLDYLLPFATREDRRLVGDVGQVGAGQTRGLTGDLVEVDTRRQRLARRVHAQDLLATDEIGRGDEHLPVEAAGAQEGRVEVLDAVRCAHDDDLRAGVEAVQLDEQLVERLVLLAVEAVSGAGGADGVELVDEHDRGRVLARLDEELADARRTEAGEHLDEGGRARRVEARAGLVGERLREQRLAGAGRPVEQDPFRHACAEQLEALRDRAGSRRPPAARP